jgi:hypothetical protein
VHILIFLVGIYASSYFPRRNYRIISLSLLKQVSLLTFPHGTHVPSSFPCWNWGTFYSPSQIRYTSSLSHKTHARSLSLPETVHILDFLAGTSASFVINCSNRCTFSRSLLEQLHSLPCPGETYLCFPLTCLDPLPFSLSWVLTGHFHTLAGLI